jgi:hypothetical protein
MADEGTRFPDWMSLPRQGQIMLVSRDEDGAVCHLSMSREIFGSLRDGETAQFARLLDEGKHEARLKAASG